ncbi:MAG: hypothetical protein PVI81_04160 [Anaerolineales bacterium]|jgi:hypothetical protein
MNMDTNAILPALKPHDWKGRDSVLCRPLLAGEDQDRMPLVAFGYDRPHTFEFLSVNQVPGGNSPEKLALLESAAIRNLQARTAQWNLETFNLEGVSLSIAICGDDFLAAERILDDKFVREAHRLLSAEMLAVGIPRRGMILATDIKQTQESVARFAAAISAQYHRADSAPISPLVFAVKDGRVVGYGKGQEDAGADAAQPAPKQDADIFIGEQVLVVKEPDSERTLLELIAGGEDLERLARSLQDALIQIVQHYREDESFSGRIHVRFVPDITPEAQLREALPSLENHLNGVMHEAKFQTALGEPIQIRLFYGMSDQ